MKAFLFQLMGNFAAGLADGVKLRNPPQQISVVAQLLVPPHRTNQLMLANEAAAPVQREVYTFTLTLNVHDRALNQVSNDHLPIHGRCLRRIPQGGQIR
jgi:hypothetical protein